MAAVTLTDHGSMAGSVQLFSCAGAGVKPIVGCEVYVAEDRRAQKKGYDHLTLLAADNGGYANLIKLSSLGFLEGYYYKPRVDWELLETYSSGLIALSGCLSGRVCKALEEGRPDDAAGDLDRLAQVFGRENTYVEIQNAHLETQQRINPLLAGLAAGGPAARRDGRRPLPPRRGRARPRGAAVHPVGRLAQEPEPLEVRHRALLLQVARGDGARLSGHEDALRRTLEVAERCNVELELGRILLRSSRCPTAVTRSTTSSSSARRACKRYGGSPRAQRAPAVRAQDGPRDGLHRLLPDRLGLHPLRQAERHQRRARAAARPRARSPPTASTSRTSTRSGTGCSSSASSTWPARTCRTWTSTSRSPAATASSTTSPSATGAWRCTDHHLRHDGRPGRRP